MMKSEPRILLFLLPGLMAEVVSYHPALFSEACGVFGALLHFCGENMRFFCTEFV